MVNFPLSVVFTFLFSFITIKIIILEHMDLIKFSFLLCISNYQSYLPCNDNLRKCVETSLYRPLIFYWSVVLLDILIFGLLSRVWGNNLMTLVFYSFLHLVFEKLKIFHALKHPFYPLFNVRNECVLFIVRNFTIVCLLH